MQNFIQVIELLQHIWPTVSEVWIWRSSHWKKPPDSSHCTCYTLLFFEIGTTLQCVTGRHKLINSAGYVGHRRSVFVLCTSLRFQPVGGFLQQGSLIVKEDHPVARSFPAQLHYIHPGESALAWVASSPPNPGVLLTGVADLWTLCRASAGMWAATSLWFCWEQCVKFGGLAAVFPSKS